MGAVGRILAAILAGAAGLGGLWLLAGLAASPAPAAEVILFEAICDSRKAVERRIRALLGDGARGMIGAADGEDGMAARLDLAPDGRWVFWVFGANGSACIIGGGEGMAPARTLAPAGEPGA